jgi:hypothetical protein
MDPYSHTPAQGGARQPGLTGQVKEDILCRMGELGIFVRDGEIHFQPRLLRKEEFLSSPTEFRYCDISGVERRLSLKPGSLAFTYCQVPIVYRMASKNLGVVIHMDGAPLRVQGLRIKPEISRLISKRTGNVTKIEVTVERQYE